MSIAINNNQFWKEFFELYRNMPELWHNNSEDYKNKVKRQEGWDRLLIKYKEHDENATLETLKQRVHNIRSCHRRECRKVDKNLRSRNAKSVYKPNLWYYHTLEFLRVNDEGVVDNEQYSYDNSQTNEETVDALVEFQQIDVIASPKVKRKKYSQAHHDTNDYWSPEIQLRSNDDSANDSHSFVEEHVSNDKMFNNTITNTNASANKSTNNQEEIQSTQNKWEQDEAKIYAESWAISYRKLSNNQRIMARKAIEEIFFLGQFEKLTPSVVCMPAMPLNGSADPIAKFRYDSDEEISESQ